MIRENFIPASFRNTNKDGLQEGRKINVVQTTKNHLNHILIGVRLRQTRLNQFKNKRKILCWCISSDMRPSINNISRQKCIHTIEGGINLKVATRSAAKAGPCHREI